MKEDEADSEEVSEFLSKLSKLFPSSRVVLSEALLGDPSTTVG